MCLTMRSGDLGGFLAVPMMVYGPGAARQGPSKSELKQWLSGGDRDVALFTTHRDGRPDGRILVHAPRFNAQRTATAGFAHFDCAATPESARALLDVASSWARARGLDRIIGPVDIADLPTLGLDIAGSAPWIVPYLGENGFESSQTMDSLKIDLGPFPGSGSRPAQLLVGQKVLADPDYSFAPQTAALRLQNLANADLILNTVLGRVAPGLTQFKLSNLPRINPAFCAVFQHQGRPVGCCLGLPDQNDTMPAPRPGRVWQELGRFFGSTATNPATAVLLCAVLPPYQGLGIASMLMDRVLTALRAGGYAAALTHGTADLDGFDLPHPAVTLHRQLHLFSKAV